jgi:hypothetical protein
LLRNGAKRLIVDAVEAELHELLNKYEALRNEQGHLYWRSLRGITGSSGYRSQEIVSIDNQSLFASMGVWEEEHETWSRRPPENEQHVYICADGVYFSIRRFK